MFQEQRSQSKRGSRFGNNAILLKAEKVASPGYCNYIFRFLDMVFLSADNQRVPNGMDRSCEATIYPMLDKPRTAGSFQDRRKIEPLLRPA